MGLYMLENKIYQRHQSRMCGQTLQKIGSIALLIIGLICASVPTHAHEGGLVLAWEDLKNSSSVIDGYFVYHWLLGGGEKKRSTVNKEAPCPSDQPAGVKCFTVDGLNPGQTYQFEVTAYADPNAQESEPSKSVTHYFAKADEIVIDNKEARFTGGWTTSTGVAGFLGDDYHGIAAGTPNATATWQPELLESGRYQISAWWTAHSKRALDAPFTIHHDEGQKTVKANQTQNGSQWVDLDTYVFKAGSAGRVVLSAQASGSYVVAEAVRFTLKARADAIDSDQDGLSDQREHDLGTNPYRADTDGDGLVDGAEINQHGTNPHAADSDGDGTNDGVEVSEGRNPLEEDRPDPTPIVLPAVDIVIDNRYATYTGGWSKSTTQPGYFGHNYRAAMVMLPRPGNPSCHLLERITCSHTGLRTQPMTPMRRIPSFTQMATARLKSINPKTAGHGCSWVRIRLRLVRKRW